MAYVIREFDNTLELTDYLNDITKGRSLVVHARVQGLHNLTLIVNDGTADRTTTFADLTGAGLLPKEIMDQIKATHANMANVVLRNYAHSIPAEVRVAVVEAGYTVDKDGTANAILGFPTAADVVVGANAVAKANIVSLFHLENQRIGVLHE